MKNNFIGVILIVAVSLANCTMPEKTDKLGEQNKALVDKFLQAQLKGDVKTLDELLSDDFIDYSGVLADSSRKGAYLEKVKKAWEETYASGKYNRTARLAKTNKENIPHETIAGDWVLEWGDITSNFKDGTTSTIKFHAAFLVKEGKIKLITSFYNVADAMTQRGYKFIPPGEQQPESK